MSKVNHRDGTKNNRFVLGQRTKALYFGTSRKTMDGDIIGAAGNVFSECSRTIQRSRSGAKKFVQTRARQRDRLACEKIVREGYSED